MSALNEQRRGPANMDIIKIANMALKAWWLFVVLAFVLGSTGFAMAKLFQVNKYSTQIEFLIYNNAASAANAAAEGQASINQNDLLASQRLVNTYKRVFLSKDFLRSVSGTLAESYHEAVSWNQLRAYITFQNDADSNAAAITITTDSADLSYKIGDSIMKNFENLKETVQTGTINVFNRPDQPPSPDPYPQTYKYTIYGVTGGLIIAALIVLLMAAVKKTIHDAEDLQQNMDITYLASVPAVRRAGDRLRGGLPKGLLITDPLLGFGFLEVFRLIRNKIEILNEKKGYKVFLVWSATENEGKTTVASNLALSLANNGKSVLLIDGDLRKPSVQRILSLNKDEPGGLLPILKGSSTITKSIKFVDDLGVFVLLCGGATENSSEFLSSRRMREVIETVRDEFDYIIIDSSPMNLVVDAAILAGFCDASLMVVRQDYAKAKDIERSVANITEKGTPIAGCIMNITKKPLEPYRKHSYRRGYGYGYGYSYNMRGDSAEDAPKRYPAPEPQAPPEDK